LNTPESFDDTRHGLDKWSQEGFENYDFWSSVSKIFLHLQTHRNVDVFSYQFVALSVSTCGS